MNSTIRRPALLESAKPGINDPINFLGDLRFLGNRPDLICKASAPSKTIPWFLNSRLTSKTAIIRSAVVREVKKQGGNATVQVSNNNSFAGIIHAAPGVYMAAGVKRMQFAVCSHLV